MEKFLHPVEPKNVSYDRNKFRLQKKLKSFTFLTATCMLMFFSFTAFNFINHPSQLNEEPIDVIVGNAAPHIPVMDKTDKTQNINALNLWIASYPDEVIQYKKVILPALKSVKVKTLSPTFASAYNDTKAQYKLITKILNR